MVCKGAGFDFSARQNFLPCAIPCSSITGAAPEGEAAALHRDRILGVAGDVPARADSGVGKEGAHAGEVLFGLLRVNLVFDFVVFEWNGKEADAVDAAGGRAYSGVVRPELKPKIVAEIDEQEQGQRREEYTASHVAEERIGKSS